MAPGEQRELLRAAQRLPAASTSSPSSPASTTTQVRHRGAGIFLHVNGDGATAGLRQRAPVVHPVARCARLDGRRVPVVADRPLTANPKVHRRRDEFVVCTAGPRCATIWLADVPPRPPSLGSPPCTVLLARRSRLPSPSSPAVLACARAPGERRRGRPRRGRLLHVRHLGPGPAQRLLVRRRPGRQPAARRPDRQDHADRPRRERLQLQGHQHERHRRGRPDPRDLRHRRQPGAPRLRDGLAPAPRPHRVRRQPRRHAGLRQRPLPAADPDRRRADWASPSASSSTTTAAPGPTPTATGSATPAPRPRPRPRWPGTTSAPRA